MSAVCVLDRKGAVVHEARTMSTAEAIIVSLAKAPACRLGARRWTSHSSFQFGPKR